MTNPWRRVWSVRDWVYCVCRYSRHLAQRIFDEFALTMMVF